MQKIQYIQDIIRASIETKKLMLADAALLAEVEKVADLAVQSYLKGGKILVAGNGGSAADAQHFAAEYVGRFYYDRPALPAIALSTDTSALTAIGNDYGYEYVFARQVEAHGREGDIFFAISTSGNSASIVKALESAKARKVTTVGLTGMKACKMDALCDYMFKIPSADTPRIQEGHALLEHIICQLVEEKLFPN